MVTSPCFGINKPSRMSKIVDFPAPDGPTILVKEFAGISNDIFFTTRLSLS